MAKLDESIAYKEVILEKIQVGSSVVLSKEGILGLHFEVREPHFGAHWVAEWRGYIWGEQQKHYEFKAPADWLEAVKERFFPAWALRRWPVLYRRDVVDVKALYPELNISLPDQRCVVKVFPSGGFI